MEKILQVSAGCPGFFYGEGTSRRDPRGIVSWPARNVSGA
uniref:Uncharacterized protein n=1 Tax=Anguilla anguilla TaxID=7936 RepID=A0A0E9T1I1_ANGAN